MAKLALLIGISDYEEQTIPDLPAVRGDLEAMRQVLEDPQIAAFDDVRILCNPNRQEMADAIERLFSNSQPNDLILLYFSGHGVKSKDYLYLTSRNTRNNQGVFSRASAIEAHFIQDQMRDSPCKRQVIILDCCFSGAFAEGLSAKKALVAEPITTVIETRLGVSPVVSQPKTKGMVAPSSSSENIAQILGLEGRAVLTSSTESQPSFEESGSQISVYTRHLVEGLRTGAADLDEDGVILIEELHEFAKEQVQKAFPDMKPEIYAIQEGYKIKLAQARVHAPELEYRKEVERSIEEGKITVPGQRVLNYRRREFGLTTQVAEEIEAEVLEPYQKYQDNLTYFQETLREALNANSKLTPTCYDQLQRFQTILRLRDQDVRKAIAQLVPNAKTLEDLLVKPVPPILSRRGLLIGLFCLVFGGVAAWNQVIPKPKPSPLPRPTLKEFSQELYKRISVGQVSFSPKGGDIDGFKTAKGAGVTAIAEGRYGDAIQPLNKARELEPNEPETLIYLNNAEIGNEEAFTIAVAAPISDGSFSGLGALRGVALAQEEANADGGIIVQGRKFKLMIVLVDDKNKPSEDLAGLLAKNDIELPQTSLPGNLPKINILGIVGHHFSAVMVPLAGIYTEEKLPVISHSSTAEALYGKPGYGYVHPVAPRASRMASKLRTHITSKNIPLNKVVVFFDSSDPFSQSFKDGLCQLTDQCDERDIAARPLSNIESILERGRAVAVAFNPDLPEKMDYAKEIISSVAQLNRSGSTIELFAANAFQNSSLQEDVVKNNLSVTIVSPWFYDGSGRSLPSEMFSANKSFLDKNSETWGTPEVNWFTLMAYNATQAFITSIQALQLPPPKNSDELGTFRVKINEKLKGLFVENGALGTFKFSKNGYVDQGNLICLAKVAKTGEGSGGNVLPVTTVLSCDPDGNPVYSQ